MADRRDPYTVWVSAKAIAFAWIGAVLFPAIVKMPWQHPIFWLCAAGGLLAVVTVADGVRSRNRRPPSDFLAKTVVPVILFAVAAVFVAVAA